MKETGSVSCRRVSFAVAGVSLFALNAAAQIQTLNLNSFAVTNAAGSIAVLGTEGTNPATPTGTKETVFDGNTATFFDAPVAQNAWAGFQLRSPKVVTRVRYTGRQGLPQRVTGVLFQGANTADFSDAVTLYTVPAPPGNWTGIAWIDVSFTNANCLTPFTYVRFLAPAANSYGGNLSEVEFYGVEPLDAPPPPPVMTFADSANWFANLMWPNTVQAALLYQVQRRLVHEPDFRDVALAGTDFGGVWRDGAPLFADTQYRVRARNNAGDSDWTTLTVTPRNAARGAWLGSAGSYNNNANAVGDRLYDGNITTFFDGPAASSGNDLWSGLDLGEPRTVTGVRFLPRTTYNTRMTGGRFEAADNPDFTGAATLYTIPAAPPYNAMTEATFPPQTCRYVRYCSPNGGYGNALEIEFDLAPAAPRAPVSLTAVSSDLTNDYPVLAWAFDTYNLVSSSKVYRATAPGGPFTELVPDGVFGPAWTDTTASVGVPYYYRVSAVYADAEGPAFEGPPSGTVHYRRCERLERTWNDNTQLRSDVTAFFIGTGPYNTASTTAAELAKIFDGNPSTSADLMPMGCVIGLDFGTPRGIGKIRFIPRTGFLGRANGLVIYGSNTQPATLAQATNSAALATLSGAAENTYTLNLATNSTAYRYVFAARPAGEFYANLVELELYGWDADATADLLTAPASLAATLQPASLLLGWVPGANAAFYRIERQPAADPSAPWTPLGTTAGATFTDPSPNMGVRMLYRIAALRPDGGGGEAVAYSDACPVIAYAPGAGTGLKGHYRYPYSRAAGYASNETVFVRVDPTVHFNWAQTEPIVPGAPATTDYVGVAWCGRLIVPHDGAYTFHLTSDDAQALRLDGQFVINEWIAGAGERTATLPLTAGEHAIRVDYCEDAGGAKCILEWSGAVIRAVIPAAQLIPADLPDEDIGPWQGRTFNAPKLGYHRPDPATGGITVASYGADLSSTSEGHHFVWQPVHGSFLLEAKVTRPLFTTVSSKALLMARAQPQNGSPFIAVALMGQPTTNNFAVKGRTAINGNIADLSDPAWLRGPGSEPVWLRLKRVGPTFTCQFKEQGGDWTTRHIWEDTDALFPPDLAVGLSVC
ncbi:MAG: discoidin domain-containing protein, partial [Verrucomicrobiota bacterium]|nr:discoidin domain-containing protein [Verrucomicrobiota bacterium]